MFFSNLAGIQCRQGWPLLGVQFPMKLRRKESISRLSNEPRRPAVSSAEVVSRPGPNCRAVALGFSALTCQRATSLALGPWSSVLGWVYAAAAAAATLPSCWQPGWRAENTKWALLKRAKCTESQLTLPEARGPRYWLRVWSRGLSRSRCCPLAVVQSLPRPS